MPKSLIESLPEIVAEGKKEVQRCLERIESQNKITLQTNEYVLPAKDRSGFSYGLSVEKQGVDWKNRLIYGDNLLAMQALLCGDKDTGLPPMRGQVASGVMNESDAFDGEKLISMLNDRFETIDFEQAKQDVLPFIKNASALDLWGAEMFKDITRGIEGTER